MLTPVSDFYIVSKNIVDPDVDLAAWRLRIISLADRPLNLSYDDLRALPAQQVYRTLECISEVVSFPLPALVICELLGVPYADREDFRRWSDEAARYDRRDAVPGWTGTPAGVYPRLGRPQAGAAS